MGVRLSGLLPPEGAFASEIAAERVYLTAAAAMTVELILSVSDAELALSA
jgi:hypothetical protein